VRVSVIEARTRNLEGGLSFSTDTRIRGNFPLPRRRIDDQALQFEIDGRADSKISS
jgi:hypothetical protein